MLPINPLALLRMLALRDCPGEVMAEKRELCTPKSLYKFWNSRYFRGKLPDIPVGFSEKYHKSRTQRRTMGGTLMTGDPLKPIRIVLNPRYKDAFVIWAGTLMHEMVHVEQWKLPRRLAHGRKFNKRIKQLVSLGAYKNLL